VDAGVGTVPHSSSEVEHDKDVPLSLSWIGSNKTFELEYKQACRVAFTFVFRCMEIKLKLWNEEEPGCLMHQRSSGGGDPGEATQLKRPTLPAG
jgi:hypothetical protein